MIEYAIYGMIEPKTHRIVYINYMIYDWNVLKDYPIKSDYLEDSIDLMYTNDENNNPFWRDLRNLYEYNEVEVVVLEVLNNEYEIKNKIDKYIDWFKPRYNYKNKD